MDGFLFVPLANLVQLVLVFDLFGHVTTHRDCDFATGIGLVKRHAELDPKQIPWAFWF
jgi:hypothetical protein